MDGLSIARYVNAALELLSRGARTCLFTIYLEVFRRTVFDFQKKCQSFLFQVGKCWEAAISVRVSTRMLILSEFEW